MGVLFFPRGGSAQVVRYLARFLPRAGWDVTIACGSLASPGETFFDVGDFIFEDSRLPGIDQPLSRVPSL